MSILDTLLGVVAPHMCLNCGREGNLLCEWCQPDLLLPLPSRCYRCKRLTTNFAVCDACKKHTSLRHVWVRTDYSGSAKKLLYAYKFERAKAGAAVIAEALDDALPYLDQASLVIAVPTATSRVRQRGYDHARLIARELAKLRSFDWSQPVAHLSQSRQVGANRQQRLTQLADTFMVTNPTAVKGRHVLLVDDVVTTGATLETMARVLKRAGAKSVNAIAFAQKQ